MKKIKELLIKIEPYCFYIFFTFLLLMLNPFLLSFLTHKQIFNYFAPAYIILSLLSLPTLYCALTKKGKYSKS